MLATPCLVACADIKVSALHCEYAEAPTGLDTAVPRLAWRMEASERGQLQSAYQIQVATSPEELLERGGVLSDSGKVASDRTMHVEYGGDPRAAGQICARRVRVWDRHGEVSPWSETGTWSVANLDRTDWEVHWIGAGEPVFEGSHLSIEAADKAYERVLEKAGAIWPQRDPVDHRILEHVDQRKGSVINSQKTVRGWHKCHVGKAIQDTDKDGMPDEWEEKHALNPKRPDHNEDRDGDGYTNLEEFLNGTDPNASSTGPAR